MYTQNTNVSFNETGTTLLFSAKYSIFQNQGTPFYSIVVMVCCLTAPSHFLNSTDLSPVMTMYTQNTNVSFNETGTTLLFSAKYSIFQNQGTPFYSIERK